jgi:hypothetical protein
MQDTKDAFMRLQDVQVGTEVIIDKPSSPNDGMSAVVLSIYSEVSNTVNIRLRVEETADVITRFQPDELQ